MIKKVTFTLSKHIVGDATGGLLLGDFNDWNNEAGIHMTKDEDGALTATIELTAGQTYQYRYLLNDGRWENDDTAQYYVAAHGLHVENAVITVSEEKELFPPVDKKKIIKKTAPKKVTLKTNDADKSDLTKIEGIGKQIAALLHKNEILSFTQLSKTTAKKLKGILESGGAKFNIHNPASWPKQAKLAATDKWEELSLLQKEVKGGK